MAGRKSSTIPVGRPNGTRLAITGEGDSIPFGDVVLINPVTGAPERAQRKVLLSLDIDPEHLPGENKVWKTVKHELSFLRIPGPTFQFTPRSKFLGIYY